MTKSDPNRPVTVSKGARRLLTIARRKGKVHRKNEAAFDALYEEGLIDDEGRITERGKTAHVTGMDEEPATDDQDDEDEAEDDDRPDPADSFVGSL